MGFSDHTYNVSLVPDSYLNSRTKELKEDAGGDKSEEAKQSDQEILESTEAIYFSENVDTGIYELKVRIDRLASSKNNTYDSDDFVETRDRWEAIQGGGD